MLSGTQPCLSSHMMNRTAALPSHRGSLLRMSISPVVLSNLGSIKLKCGYHHLTNWGTCSVFCIIGEKKMSPFYDADGNVTMRETLDLGLTIDERLADGYYYSKSIRLLKYLLEHPEELEKPLKEEVSYE